MRKVSKALCLLIVLAMILSACGGKQNNVVSKAEYTFNSAAQTFPTNWSPHSTETATDSDLGDYLVAGFYEFDYKDEKHDGYKLVPLAAVGEPKDVTAEYIGKYGLAEGDTKKAYVITLKDDLKWEDGTKITANDYVESAKRLLAPEAKNYRADMLYSGNLVVHNAENYLKSGTYGYGNMISPAFGDDEYVSYDQIVDNADGIVSVEGGDLVLNINSGGNWGSNSLVEYAGANYFAHDGWQAIVDAADDEGYVKLNKAQYDVLCDIVAQLHGYADAKEYSEKEAGDYAYLEAQELLYYGKVYDKMDFEEVGVKALSDKELLLVLDKQLSGFYLLYSLTGTWLVKTDLYDKCITTVDGVYTNTYGTSVETTASFGPYKLTAFQADKQYTLTKNENYVGLTDNTYQTTQLVVDYVPEAATRLQLFLEGKLDGFGLTKDYMEEYGKSDFRYDTPGDSTFAIAFNPDFSALKNMQEKAGANINKTILTLKEFRMAMSFAMNRADFCLATSPTNSAGFAIYSTLIVSDPENGIAYRTTPQAKNVLAEFWGLTNDIGPGKTYPDIDTALESITGYNLTKAQEYFNLAYDKAIEQKLMDEDDVIEITVGIPNSSSTFYKNGYEYIVNNYTEAVKGTKLEGKLKFNSDDTIGNGFANALKSNQVNMLFGVGWTGSTLDPYGLMEAYTSSNYQYDPAFDTSTATLTIKIGGVDYTASLVDWNAIMTGDTKTIVAADGTTKEYSCGEADNDPETRLDILAALEGAILNQYDFIPVMDDSNASLRGMQIKYFTEDYVFGMGRGGIKYYTYNYTDEEWDKYVKDQGGTLNYK